MAETASPFDSLPGEYWQVIRQAQEQLGIAITPLQLLVGGRSGAAIYLVSVAAWGSNNVRHLIMKLDRMRPKSAGDEIDRHQQVLVQSPPDFVRQHVPDISFNRVEDDQAVVIFYDIAGQSLINYQTLSAYRQQRQLEMLFSRTNEILLDGWNTDLSIRLVEHPQVLLEKWLGFRLDSGQKIESFVNHDCGIDPDIPGFIIQGNIYPNPLLYARDRSPWGNLRVADTLFGFQHGDLNTNNILSRFSSGGEEVEGYFLIDFALFKENMPLLYDQRYLEMSYLVHTISRGPVNSLIDLIIHQMDVSIVESRQAPVEMAGVSGAIQAGRLAFEVWLAKRYPSLHDDLWGQYWLAGVAAGLNYTHKAALPYETRLACLIFAAANLKQYLTLFSLSLPAAVSLLYDESQLVEQGATLAHLQASVKKARHNLPSPPTNFIGRAREVAEIKALLTRPDIRLVTLTGPGGTGKTRLSLQVARVLVDHFAQGVTFVDLAAIRNPELLPSTIAHALNVREGGSRPVLQNLKDFLYNKELLLLFDNFEQISEAAPVVAGLLGAAPRIKILVTSRTSLNIRGEHEVPVQPLALPQESPKSLAEALESEAIALFRQQARAIQPGFEITESNSATVMEICRRLDGLPLAIEIAAARVKMLPPQAILDRLDHSLRLLTGGPRDLPDRQQTLRKTIDWSYDLLGKDVQILFACLGIFSGGFSLDAAEQVCKTAVDADIFAGIELLLNSSLLRRVRSATGEPRFDMLATIREYALEKVTALGLSDDMHRTHCHYFSTLSGGEENEQAFGAYSVKWLARCNEEHDNYRAAMAWGFQEESALLQATVIMARINWYWYRYGHLQEGVNWTERAVRQTIGEPDSPARILAVISRAYLALWIGDLYVAVERAREGLELSQRYRFDEGIALAKLVYGTALVNQGRYSEAYSHLVEAVELYDQQGNAWLKGTTLVHLANVSLGMGYPKKASRWLDMASPILNETRDPWSIAFGLNNYGEIARAQRDYEKAEGFYRQTEELYKQADAKGDQARLVHTFGYLALHKGDLAEARRLFLESLTAFRELGNHRGIAECLAGLAGVAFEQGHYDWGATILGAAEKQLDVIGGAWWPADHLEIERTTERLTAALGNEFAPHRQQGGTMSLDQALAYAARMPLSHL